MDRVDIKSQKVLAYLIGMLITMKTAITKAWNSYLEHLELVKSSPGNIEQKANFDKSRITSLGKLPLSESWFDAGEQQREVFLLIMVELMNTWVYWVANDHLMSDSYKFTPRSSGVGWKRTNLVWYFECSLLWFCW